MGQTCSTIVYACDIPRIRGDAALDRFCMAVDNYEPLCAGRFRGNTLVGFELATGGSGREGVADLNGMTIEFTADALESDPIIAAALKKARDGWPAFVAYVTAETRGKVVLSDVPGVYLTETETA